MKKITIIMALSLSAFAFAGTEIEFDQTLEIKCHQEAASAKCVSKDGEPNHACIEKNTDKKVSAECKSLYRATSK